VRRMKTPLNGTFGSGAKFEKRNLSIIWGYRQLP
jgi:hypothetical protein